MGLRGRRDSTRGVVYTCRKGGHKGLESPQTRYYLIIIYIQFTLPTFFPTHLLYTHSFVLFSLCKPTMRNLPLFISDRTLMN